MRHVVSLQNTFGTTYMYYLARLNPSQPCFFSLTQPTQRKERKKNYDAQTANQSSLTVYAFPHTIIIVFHKTRFSHSFHVCKYIRFYFFFPSSIPDRIKLNRRDGESVSYVTVQCVILLHHRLIYSHFFFSTSRQKQKSNWLTCMSEHLIENVLCGLHVK